MIDEHASSQASRREVRDAVDRELVKAGAEMRARLDGRDVAEVRREVAVNDPANEQGAAALMALAGGGRK